ncbi:MAG: glutathione synthase [Gammaproteobacteria bacterium]
MSIKMGIVMDPIGLINPKKDSTLAMMLEAQSRDWQLSYIEQQDLYLINGQSYALMQDITVYDDLQRWYTLGGAEARPLGSLDVLLMRKDPPFDMNYIYSTYILEQAEADGLLIVNKPQSLRDANEKLYTAWSPQCTPPTLVTSRSDLIKSFLDRHQDIILKPLSAMGGASVFRVKTGDPNINVIIETMTDQFQQPVMVQRYIPEITKGDKRILLIDGEPVPYALARIPPAGETRANLAMGGKGVGVPLTERDHWICAQIKDVLKEKGLMFVGIDVIGDYLTEINVTSPTCIRELDNIYSLNISAILMDKIASRLQ